MSSGPLNESELDDALRRTQQGDSEAFTQVVSALQWPLRCWVAVRCPPGIDPDEIVHQAFITAFQNCQRYELGTSVRGWLWTVTRHQLLGELTTLKRRKGVRIEALDRHLAAAVDDAAAEDHGEVAALRLCLAGLTEDSRELLAQHYHLGVPLGDLARLAGRSLSAIKKALFLLRRRLQTCLQQRLLPGTK